MHSSAMKPELVVQCTCMISCKRYYILSRKYYVKQDENTKQPCKCQVSPPPPPHPTRNPVLRRSMAYDNLETDLRGLQAINLKDLKARCMDLCSF